MLRYGPPGATKKPAKDSRGVSRTGASRQPFGLDIDAKRASGVGKRCLRGIVSRARRIEVADDPDRE
jgi:hypothetical protein